MFWTFQRTLLHSQLACNEMQALARTCGRRAADSMIEYTLIIPHRVIQLTTISFWSPRQGCASHKSTNKQIPSKASEEPRNTVIHFYFYFFLIHRRALLSASQRQCSQNMLREAFWTPNIASLLFDEYSQLGSRSKSLHN